MTSTIPYFEPGFRLVNGDALNVLVAQINTLSQGASGNFTNITISGNISGPANMAATGNISAVNAALTGNVSAANAAFTGNVTALRVTTTGNASFSGTGNVFKIPTADPHVLNALWSNGGNLTLSAG
jgi:hypothetical protein